MMKNNLVSCGRPQRRRGWPAALLCTGSALAGRPAGCHTARPPPSARYAPSRDHPARVRHYASPWPPLSPVFPVRILPAGRWPGAERSGAGGPRQDGYDLGRGDRAPPWAHPSHRPRACGQRRAGGGGCLGFFLLILSPRWDIDQNCSVDAWNWTERLRNSGGGSGRGHPQPNRRAVSGPVFIFKNRHTRQ